MPRTFISATIFVLSFFLLGDSRAPESPSMGPGNLAALVIARPMAEVCSPSPGTLVVVLLPVGKGAWPVEAALRHSLKMALEPGSPDSESAPRWWSLEKVASSFLRDLVPEREAASSASAGSPAWRITLPPEGPGGFEGPL